MRTFNLVLLALAASVSIAMAHAEEATDGGDGAPPPEEFVDSGDAGAGDAGAGDTGTGDTGTGDAGAGDSGTGDTGTGDTGTGYVGDGGEVVEPDGGGAGIDSGGVGGGDAGDGSTIGEPVYTTMTGGRPDDCPECRNLTTEVGTTRIEEPTPEVVESIIEGGDTGIDVIEPAGTRKRSAQ